ncbi:fat cadherin-related tumor suppressor-like, partial [Tropilaelaps mercedesae]
NVGGSFAIQPQLGTLSVAKPLNQQVLPEYYLVVRASDYGSPSLNSTVTVHIKVTVAMNAPPRFEADTKVVEVPENEPLGTPVVVAQAQSGSALYYDISLGNDEGCFAIDQSSGIVTTSCVLDYETKQQYLIIVRATNLVYAIAEMALTVHVVDVNDNAPVLQPRSYAGLISEAAEPGSVVMTNESLPLVVTATDADRDINAHLTFALVDSWARRFFRIDPSTGSVSAAHRLDREVRDFYSFGVEVCDSGRPAALCSRVPAKVVVHVLDVNDSPPRFEREFYNVTLVLPTHRGVTVARLSATDADLDAVIRYAIAGGNSEEHFSVDAVTGLVKVNQPNDILDFYRLVVAAHDGVHQTSTTLHISVVQSPSGAHGQSNGLHSTFRFSYPLYESRVTENVDATKTPLLVLTTVGTPLLEHVRFTLLNEEDKFSVGETSGALSIRPEVRFDREREATFRLVVNAEATASGRVASALIDVAVDDQNDNPPTFVDTPYHCVVPVEAGKGELVQKVRAEDPDDGVNGQVLYYLRDDYKGVFDIGTQSGNITLRKRLPAHITRYTLTVVAKDAGTPPMYSEVQVPVKVVTRTMPAFEKQFYSAHVRENHGPSEPILSLTATSPRGRPLIYDITGGHHKEDFRLDYQTGVLYVNERLDFDKMSKYDLTVRATDSVTGAYSEVSVTVSVEDVNNHPPLFEQVIYNVSVSELSPPGSSILAVKAHDKDSNSVLSYSVEDTDRFMIDAKSGVISLRRALDYEKQSSITLTVIATDSGAPHPLSSTALVFVQVTDTNDSPPAFDRPSVDCSISELARRGQFVAHLGASDPDFSPSVLSVPQTLARFPDQFSNTPSLAYQIISGSQAFTIDRYTGVVSVGNLHLFHELVKSEMDVHLLNVSVTDGVFVAFCRLRVHVVPANNHSPRFTHFEYEAIVAENADANAYVTTVSATDPDRGTFGRIRYYIQSEENSKYFAIDADSGEVRTKKPLDRETKQLYNVAVIAEDAGGRIGHSVVRVTVTDVNDNAPQFVLPEYRANVRNHTIGQTVLKVVAVDRDLTVAALRYSIHEGNPRNVTESFGIVEDTGEVYVKKPLREGMTYQFFAKASDRVEPVQESVVPVTIVALLPSQTEPYSKARVQDLYVKENAKIPTVITTLNAQAAGDVKFTLIANDNDLSLFTIDADSGRLTAIRSLDREECSRYHVGIRAESRTSGLMSLIQVNVHVMDDNDNKPQFESTPQSGGYLMRVAENIPVGSKILRLMANDADIDSNGVITYDFYERNDPAADIFQIDPQTGWVTNLIALDRESVPSYNLTVVARDNGTPLRQYSLTTVHITVMDYNDNPPQFPQEMYDVEVGEDAPRNTEILTLNIEDPDDPKSQTMYFYLTSGNDRNHFGLSEHGILFVRQQLDRESQEHYILEVTASDGIYVAKTKINIRLRDANDNGPVCLQSAYVEQVREDVSPGALILTVIARDSDVGANAILRYSLRGKGHEQFHINASTGELRINKPLDREVQSSYSLTAHVQDSQHMEWSCTSSVHIMVSDVNDCAPQFSKDNYTVSIPEDAEIATVLMKIYAADRDVGINRKVSYMLVDNASGHFEIQPNTGIIQLMKTLDREAVDAYRLIVEATDHGHPQLTSAVQVGVIVLDVNDNPPEFTQRTYHANVSEMAPHGTRVVQVKAFSRDIGVNAEISYSLENAEHFDIDQESGVVSVMRTLDYESQTQFMLTVVAKDGGSPTLSASSLVNVTVIDFNDNRPTFDKTRYNSVIREDTKVGEKILQIQATDADSGRNGQLSYAIVNASNYPEFGIDARSGVIALRKALDRELQSDYYFVVVARDGGEPELNETVEVSVTLSDINDNAPQFAKGGNYSAIVQEGKRDQKVIEIQVTDRDTPANAGPFTLAILNGNPNADFVVRGLAIYAQRALIAERRAEYNLQIQVSDAGTPSLSSKTSVHVKVIEESKFAPDVDDLHIHITSYLDDFPGGIIGRLHASDMDPYDKLTFELADRENSLFGIDRDEGTLSAQNGLDVGSYVVNVSVSDAKFITDAQALVEVSLVTEEALANAVIMTLADVTPEDFLLTYQKGFQSGLKIIFGLKKQNVHIISIQPSVAVNASNSIEKRSVSKRSPQRDNLDILFALHKNQQYYEAAFVSRKLRENQSQMDREIDRKILHISENRCRVGMCANGECSDTVELDRTDLQSITTDRLSFVSPRHYPTLECICQPGFGGPKCETPVNECSKNPCVSPKICIPSTLQATGYTCQCPENTGGPLCNETCAESNQDTCYIERHPLNFDERSYAHYELNHGIDKRLMFSGRLRTFQQSGVVLYASGQRDYAVLEVHNGKVQFRFDCGSGEGLVRVSHKTITDGRWHHVIVERRGNFARVSVDRKWEASGVSPGSHDILNLDQRNSLFIGAALVGSARDEMRRGFFGCMDDVKVNSVSLPLHMTGSSNVAHLKRFVNVQFKCKDPLPNPGACGTQPCHNGGTCLPGPHSTNYTCVCIEPRFKGGHCEVDTDPCASNPCSFSTLCSNVFDGRNNDFQCECPPQLSGKRCEYGQYCNPNPCQNKGVCEEGETDFSCRCPIGYRGNRCQYDIDECLHHICAQGATCINLLGGFECVCPPNVTGPFCSEHLQPPLIISSRLNTTVEELVGIVSVVSLVFLLALSTVCFFRFQFKKHRRMHSHLQGHVMLQGSTGDSLDYGVTGNNKKHKQKKGKHQQQPTTAEQCQMADLLLDIAGKKLDGGSMMNNLDKQPVAPQLNVQSSTMNSPRHTHADTALCQGLVAPTTPQSILRIPRTDLNPAYIDKEQMYSEDKIKNCSLASAASQPTLRYDDLAGYSWDYSDLTAAEQHALTANIPEHVPAINDELGFDDQSVLYNRGLNDYLPSHALSRDTSINSTLDADFVSYGFPHSGGKGFVLNHTINPQHVGGLPANMAGGAQPPSAASDGSSTSDDNTEITVVRRVNV